MCRVSVVEGDDLLRYSFPPPHPFRSSRAVRFWEVLKERGLGESAIEPERADEDSIELFHDRDLVSFVKKASALGYGYLDEGDTPAFKGIMEASEFAVGSTLKCVELVLSGEFDHGFNPVGGLHHARPDRSAGFCVFNDIGIVIEVLRRKGLRRILYVDVDVHHGDGVFYPYESDPDVFIFDVHENGRFLYPGTGDADETGRGRAEGTKINVPLLPGEGDERIGDILPRLDVFASKARPDFIIMQAGADCMANDPLGGLAFSDAYHSKIASMLHHVAHDVCKGRLIALGGGGYDPDNCAKAWSCTVNELVSGPSP